MSRGGQRERDRAKSQAKLEKNKPAQGRVSPIIREKERPTTR